MNEEVDLEGNDGSVTMINNEKYFDSIRSSGYNDTAMALGELIDNSLQAKATKVDVLIAESQNRVGRAGRRSWQAHEIAVLDNGIGMDKSTKRLIFDKFYRKERGNIHDIKGHGLGLSYVKKIIELHKGKIELISKIKEGTKFIIKLPLK